MTLEEVFQFTEANKAGKRSAVRLLETQGADATHSQYFRDKQEDLKNNKIHNKNETCSYCGKRGHGKNPPTKTRKIDYPTYGKICAHCGHPNHLKTVCLSNTKPNFKLPPSLNATSREAENAAFDALSMSAMADTGCRSCLASIKVIRHLGLHEDDLIPITMHMHAANNNGIEILGAIILRFTGRSPSG